mgnify:CR=1 FL=1
MVGRLPKRIPKRLPRRLLKGRKGVRARGDVLKGEFEDEDEVTNMVDPTRENEPNRDSP